MPSKVWILTALLLLKAFTWNTLVLAFEKPDPFKRLKLDHLHEVAPDFQFVDASGKTHHLREFDGHPLIIHFWASWCTSCKTEMPELRELAEVGKKEGVLFIPVSVEERTKSATPPEWIIEDQKQGKSYWSWGVPMTYFIDANKQIAARAMGARLWSTTSAEDLKIIFRTNK